MDTDIAIIGGGIAGLAVGIALLQLGYKNVAVYERDETISARRQGYGLTILQGITALRKLGVLEEAYKQDTPSRAHYIFGKDGKMISFFGTIFWMKKAELPSKKRALHLQRQELRQLLLTRYISLHPLKEDGIRWNHRISEIKANQISFHNGLISQVDLVIGADGINGSCRAFKYPIDKPLSYLGIIVVLGITGCNHFLTKNRVFQTMDGSLRFFIMPFSKTNPQQSVMWQLSFPLDLPKASEFAKDSAALKSFLIGHCSDWHAPIPEMIESTETSLLMGLPAYDRDLNILPESNEFKIVLLGDAAHPMSPFKGQGANQALIDAVEFADSLHNSSNLKEAVKQYEQKMIKRAQIKVMQSRERVISFHQPEALEKEDSDKVLMQKLNSQGLNAFYNEEAKGEPIEAAISRIMHET